MRRPRPASTSRRVPQWTALAIFLTIATSSVGAFVTPLSYSIPTSHRPGSLQDIEYEINAPLIVNTDPSDHRYAARDWWQNMLSMPRSTILWAIKGPVLAVMTWSFSISVLYAALNHLGYQSLASRLCWNSMPHSFLVSALGLLLVFRTNSAYQRFNEGRKIWERILSLSRNLSRLTYLYEGNLGAPKRRRVARLLAAFPYLLHHHIQPHGSSDDWSESEFGLVLSYAPRKTKRGICSTTKNEYWVDRRTLPWCLFPPQALQRCVQADNRPLWVCDCLSQEFAGVAYSETFSSRERLALLGLVDKLTACLGECERIHQTAVPLNYARHSLRSLTLWLWTLPFCLVREFGWGTAPVMGLASWLLYGIYEIGYTIEDPFQGSLRLSILCEAIYRDVMYGSSFMKQRQTAFEVPEESEWSAMDVPRIAKMEPEGPELFEKMP